MPCLSLFMHEVMYEHSLFASVMDDVE
jgi:hypothetical protein